MKILIIEDDKHIHQIIAIFISLFTKKKKVKGNILCTTALPFFNKILTLDSVVGAKGVLVLSNTKTIFKILFQISSLFSGDGLSTLSSTMIKMLVRNGESSLDSQGFNPT